jgi:hypothetical protein
MAARKLCHSSDIPPVGIALGTRVHKECSLLGFVEHIFKKQRHELFTRHTS